MELNDDKTHPTTPLEQVAQALSQDLQRTIQAEGPQIYLPPEPELGVWAEREFREAHIAQEIPLVWRAGFPSFRTDLSPQCEALKRAAMAWVAAWPPEDKRGLVLSGPAGCGKSHLACAILAALIRGHGVRGVRWNCARLFQDIRAAWSDLADWTEADLFDEICSAPLVLLDDLGSEEARDYIGERLYLLIDRLYEAGGVLIVTTNLDRKAMVRRFGANGERICSRLASMVRPLGWDGERFPRWPQTDFRRDNRLGKESGPPV